MTNQKFQDPFVAVVVRHPLSLNMSLILTWRFQIDPNRTVSAGKVDIGAFRTYPESYTPPSTSLSSSDDYQTIPLNKIEDFGVHANQYYPLEVQIFKSRLDADLLGLLWNKYWVNTLSQSALISVPEYLTCAWWTWIWRLFCFRIVRMPRHNWQICTRSSTRHRLQLLTHARHRLSWRRISPRYFLNFTTTHTSSRMFHIERPEQEGWESAG